MHISKENKIKSAIFITFAGNCEMALSFYQSCFGGRLFIEKLEINKLKSHPVICGSLVSERIIIHGSDLVHDEGRTIGNNMAAYIQCKDAPEQRMLLGKLAAAAPKHKKPSNQKLVEITDAYNVRWILGI